MTRNKKPNLRIVRERKRSGHAESKPCRFPISEKLTGDIVSMVMETVVLLVNAYREYKRQRRKTFTSPVKPNTKSGRSSTLK